MFDLVVWLFWLVLMCFVRIYFEKLGSKGEVVLGVLGYLCIGFGVIDGAGNVFGYDITGLRGSAHHAIVTGIVLAGPLGEPKGKKPPDATRKIFRPVVGDKMFCPRCGTQIPVGSAYCMKCGNPTGSIIGAPVGLAKSRLTYILLGFFLGSFGAHNFYAGVWYYGAMKAIGFLNGLFQIIFAEMLDQPFMWFRWYWLFVMYGWALFEICLVKKDADGVPFS